MGKAKALEIERLLPLICTVFITSEGRHSHIAFHSLPHPWLQVKGKGNFPSAHVQAAPFLMDKLYFETRRSEGIHHHARSTPPPPPPPPPLPPPPPPLQEKLQGANTSD